MAFVVTAVTAEVVTIASVATAVAELGMTLSVVGAVTGSKDLTKIGGYLGLAGGVTSLAAGAFDAVAGAAADGAAGEGLDLAGQQIADATYTGVNTDPIFSDVADSASSGLNGVTGLADSSSNAAQSGLGDASLDSIGNGPSIAAPGQNAGTNAGSVSDTTATNGPAAPAGANSPDAPTMKYGDNSITPGSPSMPQTGTVQPPADTSPGGIKQWWNQQPDSTKNALLQGGLKAVGGLFQGWSDDQKLALERERFNLQMNNGSSQPSISFQSKPTGIINSARGA